MDQLPFLVVHGAWVWKVAAVVFVACAYTGWAARRRWRPRRHGRVVLQRLGAPAQELEGIADGSVMVIEGILRSDGDCERYVDGDAAAAASFSWGRDRLGGPGTVGSLNRRAAGLRIETKQGPVELRGDVALLVGSTEQATPSRAQKPAARTRLCGDAGRRSAPAVWNDRPTHRWVRDGDCVVARGSVRRTAGNGGAPADYRGDAGSFALEAEDGVDAIPLAFAGAPRLAELGVASRVRAVVTAAVMFVSCSYILGSCAVKESTQEGYRLVPRGQPFELPSFDWLTVAAATPFHRGDALDRIQSEIRRSDTPEQARLDAALFLDELRGDCAHAASLLESHGQYRDAIARSQRCPRPDLLVEGRAHAALAEFETASDALQRAYEHQPDAFRWTAQNIAIHLLARRWSRAADGARWLATFWRGQGNAAGSEVWTCLALSFDVKAGKPEALDAMNARREPGAREACTLLRAELTREPGDVEALAALPVQGGRIGDDYVGYELATARDYLLLEHRPELLGERSSMAARVSALDRLDGSGGSLDELGLVIRAVRQLPALGAQLPDSAQRMWILLVRGTARAGAGDDAATYLPVAEAALPPSHSVRKELLYYWLRTAQFELALDLLESAWYSDYLAWIAALVRGDVEPYIQERLHVGGTPLDYYGPLVEGLRGAASTNDGAGLEGKLLQGGDPGWEVLPLLARHVRSNRGPLRDFARLADGPGRSDPAPWLADYGARLWLAEALEDDELAAEYRALARRHFEAVTDPEIALFLYLLGS